MPMNTKTKLFLEGDNKEHPTLYVDMVFVEAIKPILFTCLDEVGGRYICCCHRSDAEMCEWIVVPTTCERLIKLLTNQITIRSIFEQYEEFGFLASIRAGENVPHIQKIRIEALPSDFLPTAGYCMDADEGEFDEEIAVLKSVNKFKISYCEASFYVSAETLPISLEMPAVNKYISKFCQKKVRLMPIAACLR